MQEGKVRKIFFVFFEKSCIMVMKKNNNGGKEDEFTNGKRSAGWIYV